MLIIEECYSIQLHDIMDSYPWDMCFQWPIKFDFIATIDVVTWKHVDIVSKLDPGTPWNKFYRFTANIRCKYFTIDRLKENNEFSIWIMNHIRIKLITRYSSSRIQAHRRRERCDLHSVRTWFIVLIALLQDLILVMCVFLLFMLDICLKLTQIVQTSTQKLRLRRAHNP